jgi:hypothetical protein
MTSLRTVKKLLFSLVVYQLQVATTVSIDLTPHSIVRLQQSDDNVNNNKPTSGSLLLQHALLQRTGVMNRLLSQSTCPVCDDSTTIQETSAEGSGIIKTTVSKVKTLFNDGTVLDSLRDALVDATEGALGVEEISVETILPILIQAATQFTSIGQNMQEQSATTAVSADTPELIMSISDLLNSIVTAIADLLFSIINLISDIVTTIINLIVNIIISILDLIGDVLLSIINAIVGVLNSITGGARNLQGDATDGSDTSISLLQRIISSGALGGIFSNVIAMLTEQNDDSGLITILSNSANDMTALDGKLSTFLDAASDASTQVGTNSNGSTISSDTVTQILNSIVDIISQILQLIVNIIVTVFNVISSVIVAAINLIVGIILAIIDSIVSVLNSILGIFNLQADSATGTETPNSLRLIGIMAIILKSPLLDIMMCQLGLTDCSMTEKELDCQVQALSCNSNALTIAVAA